MAKILIVYPGCEEVLEFKGLLESLQHVVQKGQQTNFMIKVSQGEKWQDGAEMFRNFQIMFGTERD